MAILTNKQFLIVGAVAAVAAYFIYKKGTKLVTETFNPASDRNVVYDGVVGGIGRAISDDEHWSLGTWIYDITHSDDDPTETGTTPVNNGSQSWLSGWFGG